MLQQPLLNSSQARVYQISLRGLRREAEASYRAEDTLLANLAAGYAGWISDDPHWEARVLRLCQKRAQLQRDELLDAHAAG
ncbi:MAG TPA: hypothetical protein VIJ38_02145, partial [Acidobacteriaceae bacterium]